MVPKQDRQVNVRSLVSLMVKALYSLHRARSDISQVGMNMLMKSGILVSLMVRMLNSLPQARSYMDR